MFPGSSTLHVPSTPTDGQLYPAFTMYPLKCFTRRHTIPVRRSTCVTIDPSPVERTSSMCDAPPVGTYRIAKPWKKDEFGENCRTELLVSSELNALV